ncbi:MAG: hypothetical protein V2B19_16270 [Pseudomonadota bacterium]
MGEETDSELIAFIEEWRETPEKKGGFVPEGLLGEDAVCFDIEERDEALIRYIEIRLDEACRYVSEGWVCGVLQDPAKSGFRLER